MEMLIAQIATPIVTAIIAYFLGRRKRGAEISTLELGNYKLMLDHNNEMLRGLVDQLDTANKEIKTLHNRIDLLEETNNKLESSNRILASTNRTLHKDFTKMKDKYPCKECPKK